MKKLLALALCFAPALAHASPPHAVVEVRTGESTFERLYAVTLLANSDPAVATAELMPSQELLITGKKVGTADVVAMAGGKLVGIRIRVRAPGTILKDDSAEALAAAQKACPTLKVAGDGAQSELRATPSPGACREALKALFATDRFVVKHVLMDFDQAALQAQAAEFDAALKAAGLTTVTLRYLGATLELNGAVSHAEAQKLIVLIYQHAVGGVPLDDDNLEIALPDAGPSDEPHNSAEPPVP